MPKEKLLDSSIEGPTWLPYLDLACTTLATGLWFALPQIGAWPLVVALFPWLLRFIWTGWLTQRTPFDLPLALFVLTAALAVWAAYDRDTAWAKFWLIVGAVLLFYAFANARATPVMVRVGLITGFALGLSLYFLVTNDWTLWPAEFGSVTRLGQSLQRLLPPAQGPRLNPNDVGGLLATMLPFVAWGVLRHWLLDESSVSAKGKMVWLRVLWAWVALALVLFGLLMTSSRGAWLACAVAGLIGGLWWLIVPLETNGKGQKWIALGLAVAGLIIAVVIGTLWLVAEEISFARFFDPGTWFNRLEFQWNSLILAKDYMLTGAGLDGFMMLYSTYALLIHVGYIFHSYNLLLAIAIDQGLLGLLALVWMWVMFAALAWRYIGRPKQELNQKTDRASLVRIAALSMLIMLLHGTVDTALYGRGVLFLFVPLAFAVPAAPQEKRQVRWQRALSLIVLGIPICLALLWPQRSLSLIHSSLGSVYQSQAELGVYSWPEWPLQDEVRRQVDMSRSVSEFEKALALDPQNATANRRLGMIELSLGEYGDALVHLGAAYAAEPNVTTTRQLLGEALIVNGYIEEGQALWSDVNTEQGQLDARIFWYKHIGDAERAAWIQQAAKSQ